MKMIIIGSGIAGMSAAIQGAELGADIQLISPFISERSQSVMASGGINAALDSFKEGDSAECHAMDTLKGGCFLENEKTVLNFCQKAPDNIRWLEEMGVIFNRDKDNNICQRAFGGQTYRRTAYSGASTGKHIVSAMIQKCREYEISGQIERTVGLFFHSALIDKGRCYGVAVWNVFTREISVLYADVVIMATGGQNKLFGKTTGTEICDGYAIGKLFSQGVTLRNLEFIQYHPTTIETSHKRMMISEAARGEGGRLYYMKDGERCYFMEDLYGPKGNLMPRDIVSKCIYDCPSQVYLDISFLDAKLIHERLQEVYELCMEYMNLDVTKESIPVGPSVHFFMGGIAVDDWHETNIQALYAVGECASKYHGANRLGGNSLLAAVHSGRTAAMRAIQKNASGDKSPNSNSEAIFEDYINSVKSEIEYFCNTKSLYPADYILKDLADIMNKNLGIERCGEELENGIDSLDYYLDILGKIHFYPLVSIYENYRLHSMILLAKAILLSANERKESRGAHIRRDYPEKSDMYEKCSYASFIDGKIQVTFEKEVSNESQD